MPPATPQIWLLSRRSGMLNNHAILENSGQGRGCLNSSTRRVTQDIRPRRQPAPPPPPFHVRRIAIVSYTNPSTHAVSYRGLWPPLVARLEAGHPNARLGVFRCSLLRTKPGPSSWSCPKATRTYDWTSVPIWLE